MQDALSALRPLRDVIRDHDLRADKRLGQHFLLDTNLLTRIVGLAGDLRGRTVLEVGPGPGGLTRALLEGGAEKVIAIERDPRCIEALGELIGASVGRLSVIEADALTVDLATLEKSASSRSSPISPIMSARHSCCAGWISSARSRR